VFSLSNTDLASGHAHRRQSQAFSRQTSRTVSRTDDDKPSKAVNEFLVSQSVHFFYI
jgi:hypothetical protein